MLAGTVYVTALLHWIRFVQDPLESGIGLTSERQKNLAEIAAYVRNSGRWFNERHNEYLQRQRFERTIRSQVSLRTCNYVFDAPAVAKRATEVQQCLEDPAFVAELRRHQGCMKNAPKHLQELYVFAVQYRIPSNNSSFIPSFLPSNI